MRVLLLAGLLLLPFLPAQASTAPAVPSEDAARDVLGDLGVDLAFERTFEGRVLTHARFRQMADGLPVEGTRAQVSWDREGRVVHTIEEVRPGVEGTPCFGREGASLAKAAEILPGATWTAPRAEHLVTRDGDTVWRVTRVLVDRPGAWKADVACDGSVLRVWDGARYAPKAEIYAVSPIVAAANPDLRDNVLGAGAVLDAPTVEVELLGLPGESGFLRGKYAYIATPLATGDGGSYVYDRADPRFEDVNAYFWVDWAQRHIQSLGFDQVHNHTATIVPRVPGAYTAFYTGEPGTEMFFGYHAAPVIVTYGIEHLTVGSKNGVADAAEDAFVILHEYGHAVLDYQAGICCTEEAGAMHEAFGDWQAASLLTRWSNGTAEGCMAAWFGSYLKDADGAYPCYRDLNNNATMDDWIPGDDPHFNQLIWSGALWSIEKDLMAEFGREDGAAYMEQLMYESNYMLPVEATFASAVEALLVAEAASHFGHLRPFLESRFVERKIVAAADLPSVSDLVGAAAPAETPASNTVAAPAALLGAGVAGAAALLRRRPRA